MIELLKKLWNNITSFLIPEDSYSWQTVIYLGLFSLAMSWIARLSDALFLTEGFIATAGWLFFALGVGWFLESNKIRPFGLSLAPWVAGAILCAYLFNLLPLRSWPLALIAWPLLSVTIEAIPKFLNWELKPKVPSPAERQYLILLLLVALLFSSWFQFYFRLQSWFSDYPSLVADDFSNSGFVYRLGTKPEERAGGIALLTAAKEEVENALNSTPWPYAERWLLNLDEQVLKLQQDTENVLEDSSEKKEGLWQLKARRPRGLDDNDFALDLIAVWSGPASDPNGYYFEKTCMIRRRSQAPPLPTNNGNQSNPSPTQMAEVECNLATPRRVIPEPSAAQQQ